MTSVDAGDKSTEVIEHLSVVEELTDAMVKPNQDESWIFDNQPSQPIPCLSLIGVGIFAGKSGAGIAWCAIVCWNPAHRNGHIDHQPKTCCISPGRGKFRAP
jgi:hypothetical protein